MPPGSSYDFTNHSDQARFADQYMHRLKECGIEVIALADHHTSAWQDVMQAAGTRADITVFPGVEVTTNSGSDGIHLLLLGDLDKSAQDIEILLEKTCGFDKDIHPRFDPATGEPAASPHSLIQILDNLPGGWLAIAPHALNDNGIASGKTARGSIRWTALHHDRLVALDVGDGPAVSGSSSSSKSSQASFNEGFRNRSLENFPCLERIAFVATSDAYSLDQLGNRYTWIRMEEPSFEALRQAFLDHEARIIRHSDPRRSSKDDPNFIDHGWIESVTLRGQLRNSSTPLALDFHPRLNVIIGGRGSGKSTIVAALRQLYGSVETLPDSLREEAQEFVQDVFNSAEIAAIHRLPISGERQAATWSADKGSITDRGGTETATSFPVRVLVQKELYERTKPDVNDSFRASRNLLLLVDEVIGAATDGERFDFHAERTVAEYRYQNAVQTRLQLQVAVSRKPELTARIAELTRQVEVLDDPSRKARREHNTRLMRQRADLLASATVLDDAIGGIRQHTQSLLPSVDPPREDSAPEPGTLEAHQRELAGIARELRDVVLKALNDAEARALRAKEARLIGPWAEETQRAAEDDAAYQAELGALGITPERYNALREELSTSETTLADLERKQHQLGKAQEAEIAAWDYLMGIYESRRTRRTHLTGSVTARSRSLRFDVSPHGDWVGWVADARTLLNFRSDGYIFEVQAFGKWLWSGPSEDLPNRLRLWQQALVDSSNDAYARLAEASKLSRKNWWERIRTLDPAIRLRFAMLIADDVITMRFLKADHDPGNDDSWQEVSHGSPGQRSAAMLSFVLHHGTEPLILDQPEDDLDTALISELVVRELRKSRWQRQLIVITHNANIPVLGDAERIIALENHAGSLRIKKTDRSHIGPLEVSEVRQEIQNVMEGGVPAFITREQRYDNELSTYRQALSLTRTTK